MIFTCLLPMVGVQEALAHLRHGKRASLLQKLEISGRVLPIAERMILHILNRHGLNGCRIVSLKSLHPQRDRDRSGRDVGGGSRGDVVMGFLTMDLNHSASL